MYKQIFRKGRVILLAVTFTGVGSLGVFAQLPPPPTPAAPPTQVPIDGGVLLLGIAGAAYGAKKLYKRKLKTP